MPARTSRFPVPGGTPALEIRNPAGSVLVEGRDGAGEVVVEVEPLDAGAEQLLDRVVVSAADGHVRVVAPERRLFRGASYAIRVLTPARTATRVETASADTECTGPLGDVRVASAGGDVTVESCTSLKVRTASGDTSVGGVDGRATVGTASGDIGVRRVGGGLDARSASGDVVVGEASGDLSVGTASGQVRVGAVSSGTVRVRTASGDVEVGVVPGLRVWLDLSSMSGRMDSQLDEEGPEDAGTTEPATVSLSLRSMSGALRVRRAATAP
jgi:Putative adhesin